MGMGNVKYWGRMWLEYMGAVMGIALALMLFFAGGRVIYPGDGINGIWKTICVFYPAYLVLSAFFIFSIGTISSFQTYLPVLVSLNATRRESVWGILGYNAGGVMAITAVIALFWMMPSSEVGNVTELLLLISGILLMFSGASVLMGAVVGRLGKKGVIIFIIFCAVFGGIFGGDNGTKAGRFSSGFPDEFSASMGIYSWHRGICPGGGCRYDAGQKNGSACIRGIIIC